MTNDDIEKIKLVDQVFSSLSLDEIKSVLSADLMINKLKGTDNSTGVILSALQNLAVLQVEIITLRTDHIQMREDFKLALKAINTLSMPSIQNYSQDLQTLKSKYGVY